MIKLNTIENAIEAVAKSTNKWVLYISYDWVFTHEWDDDFDLMSNVIQAAPFLAEADYGNLWHGQLYVVCETEQECWNLFSQVVGDEGPTKVNPYNGPVTVYAAVYSPVDGCVTTNT